MKRFYILNIILFIFTLPKYLKVHSQESLKEPLAKLWNIDNDDIPKYLGIEENLARVDSAIRLFLDEDNFGGTYIDVIKNTIFINTINFAAAERIKKEPHIKKYLNYLDFIAATNSTAILNYKFDKITKLANSIRPYECVGYIDPQINNIIIGTCNRKRNDKNNIKFVKTTKMYDPVFLYYYCEEIDDNFPSPNNMELEKRNNNIVVEIMAGDGLQKGAKHYGVCTAGFVAITKKKNITCIATAGHCYLNDNYYLHPWNSRPTGYIIGQMDVAFEHKIDFGLIPIVGNVKPVPSIRNTDSRKYRELLIDDIITVSHYGVHLCVSGYFSHVKCGHVKALSGFISLPKGFHENLFFVGLTCRYGDSGAPFFSYKQDLKRVSLNGILAGGLTNIIGDKVYGDIMGVITIDSILNTLRKDGRKIIVVTAK